MQTQSTPTIYDEIRQANDAFEAAFDRQDSTGMSQLYTPDAVLLPPGASEMEGPQAIAQFWQGAMQMGVAKAQLTTTEAEQHGDTTVEIGHFVLSGGNGDQLDHGKYLVVWKRQGDQWFLHRDIWNSSQS